MAEWITRSGEIGPSGAAADWSTRGGAVQTASPASSSVTGNSSITLDDIVPSGSGTVVTGITGSSAFTLDDLLVSGTGTVSGASGVVGNSSITLNGITPAGVGTSSGTLTLSPLKNNTGTLLTGETGATVHVYQLAGPLLVTKTGQTSDGAGVVKVNDPAQVKNTEYRIVIILTSGAEGMEKVIAS